MKKLLSILIIGGFLAACGDADNRNDGDNMRSDTTTIQNRDSVSAIDTSTSQDHNSDTSRH